MMDLLIVNLAKVFYCPIWWRGEGTHYYKDATKAPPKLSWVWGGG